MSKAIWMLGGLAVGMWLKDRLSRKKSGEAGAYTGDPYVDLAIAMEKVKEAEAEGGHEPWRPARLDEVPE